MHKVHNPFMVFRIFVTQPSRLQHLECFEAQLYGLDPLVFYPCGEYQRIRLEVILALSYAVMQRIALVVVGFHAVQHTDDYRPVRELQTEELAFNSLKRASFSLARFICSMRFFCSWRIRTLFWYLSCSAFKSAGQT